MGRLDEIPISSDCDEVTLTEISTCDVMSIFVSLAAKHLKENRLGRITCLFFVIMVMFLSTLAVIIIHWPWAYG